MLVNERADERKNPKFDNEASLREAKSRLSFARLMEQHGDTPPGEKWGRCPFCEKKSTAHMKVDGDQTWFKCANSTCPSATSEAGWTEIGYLRFKTGLSQKEAFIAYLKEAGVWKERTTLKSKGDANGGAARKNKIPTDPWADEDRNQSETPATVPSPEQGMASASAPTAQPSGAQESPAAGDIQSEQEQSGGGAAAPPSANDAPVSPAAIASSPPASLNTQTQVGAVTGEVTSKEGSSADKPGAPAISEVHEPDGRRALKDFYGRLTLSEQDESKIFYKRGLESATQALAGLKSNPRSNREILLELEATFGREEMLRSGLWSQADNHRAKDARPNAQFFGYGIIRKAKDGEKAGKGEWIFDDGNLWGWPEPILIPYFDDQGNICGLRPHKGGGKSETLVGTPQPYIPLRDRQIGPLYTVVVTEGEFKALALLQTVGVLRKDGRAPTGVAAIPGITFGKNWEVREMLDNWLESVGCKRVIVAFDNEEKGDKAKYPGAYRDEQEKRFDSERWSRYLATNLYEEIHVSGLVCTLPNEWRNEKGKADWDGALANIIQK